MEPHAATEAGPEWTAASPLAMVGDGDVQDAKAGSMPQMDGPPMDFHTELQKRLSKRRIGADDEEQPEVAAPREQQPERPPPPPPPPAPKRGSKASGKGPPPALPEATLLPLSGPTGPPGPPPPAAAPAKAAAAAAVAVADSAAAMAAGPVAGHTDAASDTVPASPLVTGESKGKGKDIGKDKGKGYGKGKSKSSDGQAALSSSGPPTPPPEPADVLPPSAPPAVQLSAPQTEHTTTSQTSLTSAPAVRTSTLLSRPGADSGVSTPRHSAILGDDELLYRPPPTVNAASAVAAGLGPGVGMYTTWGRKNLETELQTARNELLDSQRRSQLLEEECALLRKERDQLESQLRLNADAENLLRSVRRSISDDNAASDSIDRNRSCDDSRSRCSLVCSFFGRRR